MERKNNNSLKKDKTTNDVTSKPTKSTESNDTKTPSDKSAMAKTDQPSMSDNNQTNKSIFTKLKNFWHSKSQKQKIIIISIPVLLLGVILALTLAFKWDAYLFPSNLKGKIIDAENNPIINAKICLDEDNCTESNEDGTYDLSNLKYGKQKIIINKDGFQTLEEELKLKRFSNKKNFTLESMGQGFLKGQIVLSDVKENQTNLQQKIQEELEFFFDNNQIDLEVNDTGNFEISFTLGQDERFYIKSKSYNDYSLSLENKTGTSNLGTIIIEPAGDITLKTIDWLSQESISNVLINNQQETENQSGEENSDNQEISINSNKTDDQGKITLTDLKISTKIKLEFSTENYLAKTLEIEVKQGENEALNIEMVRKGQIVYTSNRDGNLNIYIANFDGSEEKRLTDNIGDNHSPYFNKDEQLVYFLSNREKAYDQYGNRGDLVFAVKTDGTNLHKISQNQGADNNGLGEYNLKAQKRTFTIREDQDLDNDGVFETHKYQLFIGNISESNANNIFTTENQEYIYNVRISNNGAFVIFNYSTPDDNKNGVYYLNTNGTELKKIANKSAAALDIATNNNKILISKYIQEEGVNDLFVINLEDNQETRLTKSSANENLGKFVSDSTVAYISTRDNKSDVYFMDINTEAENKITQSGKASYYLWDENSNLLFFTSEQNVWVTDPENPVKEKLATEKGMISYYNFYYYEGY